MRYLLAIAILALTGCSALDNYQPTCPGLRPYDPQLCRGEKWQQIPNFEIKRSAAILKVGLINGNAFISQRVVHTDRLGNRLF